MSTGILERHFARMGAMVNVTREARPNRFRRTGFQVDVGRGKRGSFFDVVLNGDRQDVEVLDVLPKRRHLLLLVRDESSGRQEKHKFLCGHDERDWFVAAVPEARGVSNVLTAMEALKPEEVRSEQATRRVKRRYRNRRRNRAFVRQGEWFFVPLPNLVVDSSLILRDEPLARSGSTPHRVEELHRSGGETVYVSSVYPQGLTEAAYKRLITKSPKKKRLRWTVMTRNPQVYVRGKVRHPDHKTIRLGCWHLVRMNTENKAAAMRHVAFLD